MRFGPAWRQRHPNQPAVIDGGADRFATVVLAFERTGATWSYDQTITPLPQVPDPDSSFRDVRTAVVAGTHVALTVVPVLAVPAGPLGPFQRYEAWRFDNH